MIPVPSGVRPLPPRLSHNAALRKMGIATRTCLARIYFFLYGLCVASEEDRIGVADMSDAFRLSRNPASDLKVYHDVGVGSSMFITWNARDKKLADEPIDLFFATNREGPWTSIARGVKNEGSFRWVPPREGRAFRVPARGLHPAG